MTIQKIKDKVGEITSIGPTSWGFISKELNRNIILGFILILLSTNVYQFKRSDAKEAACASEIRRLNELIQQDLREIRNEYKKDAVGLEKSLSKSN